MKHPRDVVGTEPTATFGCKPPEEVVGPLRPKSVQYGRYGRGPTMVHIHVNKYRPDLPPWYTLQEMVLVGAVKGTANAMTFDVRERIKTEITGALKTVTLSIRDVTRGVDGDIVTTDDLT